MKNIGHHFIIGISGPKLSDLDKKILEELQPTGILFLKRNFLLNTPYQEWLEAFSSLRRAVKEYAARDKMFFSIDHEGGRVHRTPSPLTQFPSPRYLKEKSFMVASAMAVELRSIGINVSWSPSVDINSNPQNPVIGDRAFADSAEEVSMYAAQFLRGLLEHGVLGCIKHFPGHGDTSIDSHFALPQVDKTLAEISSLELKPFAALINQGAPMVMTSHILFPAIDENPATLSKFWLQDILRKELGFAGVIVTDDLDMKAVSEHHPDGQLVHDALSAGCELFIVARHPDGSSDKPLSMAAALHNVLKDDKTLQVKSAEAKEKIEYLLRYSVGDYTPYELTTDVLAAHGTICTRTL